VQAQLIHPQSDGAKVARKNSGDNKVGFHTNRDDERHKYTSKMQQQNPLPKWTFTPSNSQRWQLITQAVQAQQAANIYGGSINNKVVMQKAGDIITL